jgi:TonB-linked SusC/RagA family outer membrane protein
MKIILRYSRLWLIVCISCAWISASAQTHAVTGKVTAASDNSALPGVTVRVQGTNNGVVTDNNGEFRLSDVPSDGIINATSIGFKTTEIQVNGRSNIDIQLQPSNSNLNEVVVVGYGKQTRKDLTGSISSLHSKNIERANPVNSYQAIQGQAAGVNISKTSGLPGKGYDINIRGLGSINYNNAPLVVIDGIMGGDLNTINPSDIASIDILKDASATAIYGSRGANGVIIVTTKKGKEGKAKITYSGYVGLRVPAHLPKMMNAQQYYNAYTKDIELSGGSPISFTSNEIDNAKSGKSTDWVDEVTRPALQTSHVLAVSGGTKSVTYYFSGGYLDEKGNTIGESYKRYNINGSMDARLNKVIKVGFTSYYSYGNQNTGSFETLRSAYRARPTGTVRYDNLKNPGESSDIDFHGYAVWMGINDHQVMNPMVEGYPGNTIEQTLVSNLMANGYLELTPLEGLSIKSSLSTTIYGSRNGDYRGTFSKSNKTTNKPTAAYNTVDNTAYTFDNILTYKFNLGQNDFTFTALQSAYKQKHETYGISVKDLPYESGWHNLGTAGSIKSVESDLTQRTLLSYMGRLNYSLNDKYLLTLTGRWDGASVLAEGHKWGFFPSAAFAWRLINEPFIKKIPAFSDLKLRLSYGLVGNDVVPPYGTAANLAHTDYDFGGASAYGFAPDGIANHDLGWEKNKEVDLGLDLGFLNNRIMANIDVYRRNTIDLILKEQLPITTGFSSVNANLGKVMNEGLEVTINTANIQTSKFSWHTNISFSTNHNEIKELYGGDITRDVGNGLFVGEPIKVNYDYKFAGIWQSADSAEAVASGARPGEVKAVDINHDGKIKADSDRVILGSPMPKWMMGITNTFSYKNWDFSFMIYTRQGVQFKNSMESGTMGQMDKGRYNVLALNYWTPENRSNDYYGLISAGPYENAVYYQNASFWRISDITLGYHLPQPLLSRWKLESLRVYLQVHNPFVFTSFNSFDPEYNANTYIDDVPSALYTFGVNLSF